MHRGFTTALGLAGPYRAGREAIFTLPYTCVRIILGFLETACDGVKSGGTGDRIEWRLARSLKHAVRRRVRRLARSRNPTPPLCLNPYCDGHAAVRWCK